MPKVNSNVARSVCKQRRDNNKDKLHPSPLSFILQHSYRWVYQENSVNLAGFVIQK